MVWAIFAIFAFHSPLLVVEESSQCDAMRCDGCCLLACCRVRTLLQAKCLCYVLDVVTQDDTTQKDGLVAIIQTSLDIRDSLASPSHQREDVRIVEALPARLTGFHIAHPSESCHNSDGTTTTGSTVDSGINLTRRRIVQALLLIIMGQKLRRVTRVHDGEYSIDCCSASVLQ
jgi:hypothetical protein